jgi:Abortive infection C-terminus
MAVSIAESAFRHSRPVIKNLAIDQPKTYIGIMKLLKLYRNQIGKAIEAVGLDRKEFDLDNIDAEVRITHKRSQSHFIVGGDAGHYVGSLVVGDLPAWPYTVYSWQAVMERVAHWLRDVKLDLETPDLWAEKNRAPGDAEVSDTLASFDSAGVHVVWEKALARRDADPDGAITTARTLLETVSKRILDEAEAPYNDTDNLPALYNKVATQLHIAPSQQAEDAFRRIFGGCASVVEGLGTLRNRIGDAHGKGSKPVRAAPRHAQLAVNLAGAMATFLVETWIAQGKKDSDAA